jgi:hypothetical protein
MGGEQENFFPDYLGVNDIGGIEPGLLSATYEDPVVDVVPGSPLQLSTSNGLETDAGVNDCLVNPGDYASQYTDELALSSQTDTNLTQQDYPDTAFPSSLPRTTDMEFDTFEDMNSWSSKRGSMVALLSVPGSAAEPTTHHVTHNGSGKQTPVSGTSLGILLTVLGVLLIFLLANSGE